MEDSGLGLACGLVRHAGAVWLAADDPTGESLFLAAECFDLEGLFAEAGVVPELADPGLGAAESLDRAAGLLESARSGVPLGLWAALQALRVRAS